MALAGKIRCLALLALLPGKAVFAAQPALINPFESLGQMPVQQYVSGDSTAAVDAAAQSPAAPSTVVDPTVVANPSLVAVPATLAPPPAANAGLPPPVQPSSTAPPVPAPTVGVMPVPSVVPAGPQPLAVQAAPNNVFAGGMNNATFLTCARLAAIMCNRATDNARYQTCLTRLTNPACGQFLAFVTATGLSLNDDVDLIKQYPQAQLDLIHISRFGMNYPGDYYVIGANGDVTNITSGQQAQAIDITKNVLFPQIQARFPKAQLWSIVDKLPQASTPPEGSGLRLIFRFNIMNGCPGCEVAGYAQVAYDFSQGGQLQRVQLLSLEPV